MVKVSGLVKAALVLGIVAPTVSHFWNKGSPSGQRYQVVGNAGNPLLVDTFTGQTFIPFKSDDYSASKWREYVDPQR